VKKPALALLGVVAGSKAVRMVAVFAIAAAIGATSVHAALPPSSSSGTAPVSDAVVGKYVSDAHRAIASGNLRLAVILLKNAVAASPKNGTIRAQLGIVLLQTGDPVSAEHELRQARADGGPDELVLNALYQAMLSRTEYQALLNEFPEPPPEAQGSAAADVLKARAVALQSLGRQADAAASMDRSLKLRRDIPGLLARARLAQKQDNTVLAKQLDDEALKLNPASYDALMFKLGLEMLSNDLRSALALSSQIIQQYPKNIGPHLARIETLLKMKQDKDAKADVDALLARTPNIAAGIYYRALLMARANDVKGAWKLAQSLPPEFTQSEPTFAIMMSQMAIESGSVETGAAILTLSLARNPDLLEIRLRLATVRLKQNSPEAALSVLLPVKDSADPRVQALLSQVYLKLGKYTEALDVLNRLNSSGSSNAGVKRELALVKMRSGQSDQAIKDLFDLVAKQPTDPSLVGPLVVALAQNGRFAEALAAADRLGSDPKQRAQALFFRGQILVRQGDTKGAIAALGKAIQIEPKNIASLYYRADLYESLKQYAEASRDLEAIVALDANNVSALVKLAEVYARQGQDKPVRTLLAKATSVAPKDPVPRIALVRFLLAHHDLKGAQGAASDLLKVVPNNPDGLALTGEIQLASGQKREAVATYRVLTNLLPRSAKPQLLLSNALFVSGDRVGAGVALSAAGNIEPNSGEIRAAQITLLFAQGNPDGAIAAAKAYRSANPSTAADLLLADTLVRADRPELAMEVLMHSSDTKNDARLLLRLVTLEARSGDRKKAEGQLASWLKSNPNDIAVRSQYATFLMQDGDKKTAVAQFEMVLLQDANNIPALNNLGWLLQKEDPKRALSLLSLAYKLGPDLPDIVDSLGWIKLQLNDPKAALPLLTRAHTLRPKDGELTYHLIVALDANGKRNDAKAMLKTLLASGVKFDDLAKAQALAVSWH